MYTTWGVAFHDRFVAADPPLRRWRLCGHLFFNSLVFVLMHVHMARTSDGPRRRAHQMLGRVNFVLPTQGVGRAVWLASEHGALPQYGGLLAESGFDAVSVLADGTASKGVVALLICIWFSAPLGLRMAESIRRRIDEPAVSSPQPARRGANRWRPRSRLPGRR